MKTELKAFEEAAKLPEHEQEKLGTWILEELASERRWDELFSGSSDKLAELAKKVLAEHRAGRTQDLDPETVLCEGPDGKNRIH